MKKLIILLAIVCQIMIAGCSTVNEHTVKPADVEKKQATINSVKRTVNTSPSLKQSNNKTNPKNNQKLVLNHIILFVTSGWIINKGLDSASFSQNAKPIGGIDGLGYSDSIENLLPNQSKSLNQKEITISNMKAYSVVLERDTTDGNNSKEIHIIYLLPEKKTAYDLHFNLALMHEDQALRIANSALQK